MRKLFLMLAMLVVTMNVSAKIVDNISFASVGYSYNYKAENHPHQVGMSFSVFGVFIEYSSGLNGKSEEEYGNGGVSDDYRYSNVSAGYLFSLYREGIYEKPRVFAGPVLGVNIEERLYNDRYYDSDVADRKCKFDGGFVAGVRLGEYGVLTTEATLNRVSISLGVSF